jgi:hypothetical protein
MRPREPVLDGVNLTIKAGSVSERSPLTPLRCCLFTPELQW